MCTKTSHSEKGVFLCLCFMFRVLKTTHNQIEKGTALACSIPTDDVALIRAGLSLCGIIEVKFTVIAIVDV